MAGLFAARHVLHALHRGRVSAWASLRWRLTAARGRACRLDKGSQAHLDVLLDAAEQVGAALVAMHGKNMAHLDVKVAAPPAARLERLQPHARLPHIVALGVAPNLGWETHGCARCHARRSCQGVHVWALRRPMATRVTCHSAACWTLQDANVLTDASATTFWLADLGVSRKLNRARCFAEEDIPCALLQPPALHVPVLCVWHVHARCCSVSPATMRCWPRPAAL